MSCTKIRHCAYCLRSLSEKEVKTCGRCHRRAYCGKECQVADWSLKSKGQGHKNWCHLACGEEDLDWEVASVPGKGQGLIAKVFIPAKFRILVDACRPRDHPGIQDLMPLNGTLEEKFQLNCLGTDEGESVLCLRLSRVNHECGANAEHVYDDTFNVKILYAVHDVQAGGEISISYHLYSDISKKQSAEFARSLLQMKWGIVCPDNCWCYNKQMAQIIKESKKLDSEIFRLVSQGSQFVDAALRKVKQLLKNHEIMNATLLNRKRTFFDAFQIAVMRKKTLCQAQHFIKEAYDISLRTTSPLSEDALKHQRLVNDMSSHRYYLIYD